MQQMEQDYHDLFDLTDATDKFYHDIIPTIDACVLKDVLTTDIDIINNTDFTLQEWSKFKYQLLQYEKNMGVKLFEWPPLRNHACPFVGIDICWETLKNLSARYYQIHMALENVWMQNTRLVNIWDHLPEF